LRNTQVLRGDGRLGQRERVDDLPHRPLAFAQEIEDRPAVGTARPGHLATLSVAK